MTMEENIKKKLGLDETVDVRALLDSTLNEKENRDIITEEVGMVIQETDNEKNEEDKYKDMWNEFKGDEFNYDNLYNKKVILIFGETGSGKTALSMKILTAISKHKSIYVYKFPIPKIVSSLGFTNMYNISELSRVSDCAVFIDEAQLVFPKEDKKSNEFLQKLYTLARQRKITIIFATSDSRWVTKGTEYFVNSWFIKDCEAEMLKNGSRIKNIIKNASPFGLIDFKLNIDEFLYYDRKDAEKTGSYKFKPPVSWNEIISCPYQIS